MKITRPAALTLAYFLVQALAVSADMKFTPPGHSVMAGGTPNDRAQTAANFGKDGAKMEVCPSGDCTNGQFMRLTMSSIKEVGIDGSVVQSVETFNKTTSDWSEMVTSFINGVNVSSTSYVTTLTVGADAEVSFNLTASIFASNTTVAYGNQTVAVPVGGLKFTLDFSTWPFASADNTLTVAVKMESKGKGGKAGKPTKKPHGNGSGNSTHTAIERVDMGNGMFMDAPTTVIVDGVEATVVNSSVVASVGGVEFQWVFPHFESTLHYDPVLGEDSNSTSGSGSSSDTVLISATDDSTSAPTPTPTSTTASSAVALSLSSIAAGLLAAFACNLV
ncbi:hypothetical protein BBJ28_00000514 [Nothophytophthora sp. Chile5]|nr:hypothetical protein BBJ28_00000514 [Nothophytophthora sp. Chile5]